MKSARLLALGGIFSGFSVIFQCIPALFSEIFAPLAMLSSIPIYIMSRISPKAGLTTYLTSAALILTISFHEGIFFLFTTGLIGLLLGITHKTAQRKDIAVILTSIALTISLCFITFGIGIPVFGFSLDIGFKAQIAVLFGFSLIYNTVFIIAAGQIYKFCIKKIF